MVYLLDPLWAVLVDQLHKLGMQAFHILKVAKDRTNTDACSVGNLLCAGDEVAFSKH
jgi:hypothetical protein